MPTIASLFSGGGLVEAGAIALGYRPIWGVESDRTNPNLSSAITDNYERNFNAHIIRQPVEQVDWTKLEPPDLLWASPVCKRFSSANSQGTEDEKDFGAAFGVQRALEILQPSIFCLENVRAYQKSRSLQIIRDTLYRLDYGVSEEIRNAADYGVPQSRDRLFLRAVKGHFPPAFPPPTNKLIGWSEAIADLIPELPESQLAPWQRKKLSPLLGCTLSDGRNADINTGVPTLRQEDQPSFAITNAAKGMPIAYLIERSGARSDRDLLYRTQGEPSWTLRASIGTDQNGNNRHDAINAVIEGRVVRLTPRALARLQSVPDWYQLPDEICIADPLVGNGVPCRMAQIILEGLKPYALPKEKLIAQEPNHETIGERFPDALLATTTGRSETKNLSQSSNMTHFTTDATIGDRDRITVNAQATSNSTDLNDLTLNDVPRRTSFNVEVLLSSPMTEVEARQCIEEINKSANRIRQLLVELEERQGYSVLGFENMSQLMKSEYFDKARSTLQKELQAGRIENQYLKVPVGTFSEKHLRALSKLDPIWYKSAIEKAEAFAGNQPLASKHISRAVAEMVRSDPATQKKGIVEKIKEKTFTKASDLFRAGDVFILIGLVEGERKYDGCWAIAEAVNNFTLEVFTYNGTLQVKPDNLTPIDSSQEHKQVWAIAERVKRLRDCGFLDRAVYSFLEHLGRQTYLTPFEEKMLKLAEDEYLSQKSDAND